MKINNLLSFVGSAIIVAAILFVPGSIRASSVEAHAHVEAEGSLRMGMMNTSSREEMQERMEASTSLKASTSRMGSLLQGMKEKRDEMMQEIKTNRDDFKAEMEKHRDEIKQEWVSFYSDILVKRFDMAVDRLDNIITRAETRVLKLESEGKDVSSAKTNIAAAHAHLADASTEIASLKASITAEMSATTTVQVKRQNILNLVKSIKDDLKTAHQSLMQAIISLKGVGSGSVNASTSVKGSAN